MPQNMRSAVVHITNVDLDSSHKLGWATGVELLSIEPTDLSDQEALGLRLLGYDLLVQPDETQTIAPRFQAQRRGASAGLVFASWKPGDGAPYDQPGIDLAVVGSQP